MIPPPSGVRVFAVECTSLQLTWDRTGVGELHLDVDGARSIVPLRGGPGCIDVGGLAPGRDVTIRYRLLAHRRSEGALRARTLPMPPGDELDRFATLTDLHLARRSFGLTKRLWDPPGGTPHSVRCAVSALDDLLEWGASQLVIKGDLVETSRPHHWAAAARVLGDRTTSDGSPLPIDATPGNHETNRFGTIDPTDGARRAGLRLHVGTEWIDRPGLRIVLMNSALPSVHHGTWTHCADEVAAAVRDAPAALVVTHHHPHLWPVQTIFPPGVARRDTRRFVTTVLAANPRVLGTSGHTHRHRRHEILGMPWTETGSPKDYPGTWTGYVVHEGGIRQVVRRVTDPDPLDWLERTAGAVGGLWGRWSPGRLTDRCFTWRWPAR